MKQFYTILFSSITYLSVLGQDYLQGVVVEEDQKGNFNPLIGVNIYWLNNNIGTTTDTSGSFTIKDDHSDHHLVISYVGYQSDTINIEDHNKLTVILKSSIELKEINVIYREKSTKISFIDPIKSQLMGEKELFKAACCNLSESFETNPSVDISFSDAVTGTKQIEMLGLSGIYTQITFENVPYLRGLASNLGLTYVPGSWMESIQVTQGIGTVINGYESIAGQINLEMKKPEQHERKEKLFLNTYVNQSGRTELNVIKPIEISEYLSTSLLLHGSKIAWRTDGNKDGFMDVPIGDQLNMINRWKYENHKGIEMQAGVQVLKDQRLGGEIEFDPEIDKGTTNAYGLEMNTDRIEGWMKTGYVFPEKKYKSIGIQLNALSHNLNSYFGFNDYIAKQRTLYGNLIYQSIINNTNHRFRTGISFLLDQYDEKINLAVYKRTEQVPGVFFEYTYSYLEKFSMVSGLRFDYNNIYGLLWTPRLHTRYALNEHFVFRTVIGKGQRTANILSENISLLASSRQLLITSSFNQGAYGLSQEAAWNAGANLTYDFRWNYRDGYFTLDYHRTDFLNQVVVDRDDDPQKNLIYNLSGVSYSNSIQAEANYELIRRLDVKIAYRWLDVKTNYTRGLLQKPLIAKNRAFINTTYETINKWAVNFTLNWIGEKRLPITNSNPVEYQFADYSPDYFLMNGQISKSFNNGLDFYLGMENITGFRQINPIIANGQPFSQYFDSSIVWGPIFGRMIYLGMRWSII